MKRLFLALVCFVAFCLAGCASVPLKDCDRVKAQGEVAIVDSWATAGIHGRASSFGRDPAMRGITLVVANPTSRYVEVEATCRFEDDQLFGQVDKAGILANSKRKIMVLGFNQCMPGVCDSEEVSCSLRQR